MPATFSFLEWNSVGFSLLENLSMSLVFSQREAPCGAGFVYVRHIAREMQDSEQCAGGRTSPGWTGDEGTAREERVSQQLLQGVVAAQPPISPCCG